jgi:class 3 adenylate cyclase
MGRGSLKALFFSDIEGSTRLAAALGSAWPEVLDRHREIVRAAIGSHGGEEQGT